MSAYILEYGNMLLRWLHVVAAIAWIGESIYFVMLDNSLHAPKSAEGKKRGVFGEMWAVHGGGFYHNQKYLTNPAELPDNLHWAFWKAYTTWLSGFALFTALYLLKPSFYLINPNSEWAWVSALSSWQAIVLALAFLALGWVVYDQLCRRISPEMQRDGILSVAVAFLMMLVAWLCCHIFPGRAAFLITAAVMATCMSANVFFWIIPGQRRMVKALKTGQQPDPLDGKRGKQRSVHNTYFTLPVVLLMLSNHYSFLYSGKYAWIILFLFILSGAIIRQYFVLRHSGQNKLAYPLVGIALLALIGLLAAPRQAPAPQANTNTTEVSTSQIQQISQMRCVQCHAATPTQAGFLAPPAGVALETEQELLSHFEQIKQVVANGYMPLGNLTGMTQAERDTIAAWQIPVHPPTHK